MAKAKEQIESRLEVFVREIAEVQADRRIRINNGENYDTHNLRCISLTAKINTLREVLGFMARDEEGKD